MAPGFGPDGEGLHEGEEGLALGAAPVLWCAGKPARGMPNESTTYSTAQYRPAQYCIVQYNFLAHSLCNHGMKHVV